MQRKPGFTVTNCNIKMPEPVNIAVSDLVHHEDESEQQQRRQQLINFGHSQWGFNNWNWSVNKQELDFVDFLNGKYCAGVVAFVSISVKSFDIHRENIGYATSVAATKGMAIYKSRKCAVTNALRETLLSFGGSVATDLLELPDAHAQRADVAPAPAPDSLPDGPCARAPAHPVAVSLPVAVPPHSAANPPSSTVSSNHPVAATNHAVATSNHLPSSSNHPPISSNHPPVSSNHPPVSSNHPPVSSNHPPVTSNHVPVPPIHPVVSAPSSAPIPKPMEQKNSPVPRPVPRKDSVDTLRSSHPPPVIKNVNPPPVAKAHPMPVNLPQAPRSALPVAPRAPAAAPVPPAPHLRPNSNEPQCDASEEEARAERKRRQRQAQEEFRQRQLLKLKIDLGDKQNIRRNNSNSFDNLLMEIPTQDIVIDESGYTPAENGKRKSPTPVASSAKRRTSVISKLEIER